MDFDELGPILCGRCGVVVEIMARSDGETRVCCPICGETDTLADARREASRHTAHEVLSAMLRGIRGDGPDVAFRFVEGGHPDPWPRAPARPTPRPAARR